VLCRAAAGSSLLITERTGKLEGVKRNNYLPYGESANTLGGRSDANGYIAESVRQGFGGYEEDTETGLDFAQARYMSAAQGRFTSVDPLLASGNPVNPKTWNRYAYTLNNPLRYVDPTGLVTEYLNNGHGPGGDAPKGGGSVSIGGWGSGKGKSLYTSYSQDPVQPPVLPKLPNIALPGPTTFGGGEATPSPLDISPENPIPLPKGVVSVPGFIRPVSYSIVPYGTNPNTDCCPNGGLYGRKLDIIYQVYDQGGNLLPQSGLVPMETITDQQITPTVPDPSLVVPRNPVPSPQELGGSRLGTPRVTDSKGQFRDAPIGFTGPAPFTASATQRIFIQSGNTLYPVATVRISVTGTAPKQGEVKLRIAP
jgi:RHS repeat-associated protein